MKLDSELTARTILRWRPRTHHHGFVYRVLAQLSTSSSLDSSTAIAATNAVGRIPELLMTEQTHSTYARPRTLTPRHAEAQAGADGGAGSVADGAPPRT